MMLLAFLLTALVLHQTTGEETKALSKTSSGFRAVEAKDVGAGYGYSNNNGYGNHGGYGNQGGYGGNHGYGGNNGHGGNGRKYGGHGNGGYNGGHQQNYGNHNGGRNHGHQGHKLVPLKMPWLDKNGCRFPGDVVCDPGVGIDPNGFLLCLMNTENKNLWKKPTIAVAAIACPMVMVAGVAVQSHVVNDFCNDNKRIMKAVGFIQEKDETNHKYFHQGQFIVDLNPCFVVN